MIWVYIVFALVSMFLSSGGKKPTAKDAAVGVAAGLGAYYVGTQTEWGKSTVSSIEGSLGLGGSVASTQATPDGSATVVKSASDGSILAGLGAGIGSAVKTLAPVAAAAGVGAALGSGNVGTYLRWGAVALAVVWLMKKPNTHAVGDAGSSRRDLVKES